MSKFRNRLTLIFILFLSLSNVATGIFTISVLRDSQIRSLREDLGEKLQLYITTMDWVRVVPVSKLKGQAFQVEADRIAARIGVRVTFFDSAGNILGDSGSEEEETLVYVTESAALGALGDGSIRFGESMDHLNHETLRIASYLVLGLLAILLITALISYRISQGLTSPLEKITRVAHQITNLNYKARVSIRNRDEVGQLGLAINAMAESLQNQMNRIREEETRLKSVLENMLSGVVMIDREQRIVLVNRSAEEMLGVPADKLLGQKYEVLKTQHELVKRIGECFEQLEHIDDVLVFYFPEERTLDIHLVPLADSGGEQAGVLMVFHDISAVRKLERVRSEFVANVTHELKTPIAAVKGFAETLLGGAVKDPGTAADFLQIIYDESERLDRLVGDILDLSKIESRRVRLQFSPIEMKTFLERTVSMLAKEAERKDIQLEIGVGDHIFLEADEDRLRQIVLNLMANGINFTASGGRVKVTAETEHRSGGGSDSAEDEVLRIVVEDNGIGIPKKDRDRIFERFYRVDKARTRASGGTGLGLSIVKHLVELHKGTIRVESTVGVGTRFIIELPVLQ